MLVSTEVSPVAKGSAAKSAAKAQAKEKTKQTVTADKAEKTRQTVTAEKALDNQFRYKLTQCPDEEKTLLQVGRLYLPEANAFNECRSRRLVRSPQGFGDFASGGFRSESDIDQVTQKTQSFSYGKYDSKKKQC